MCPDIPVFSLTQTQYPDVIVWVDDSGIAHARDTKTGSIVAEGSDHAAVARAAIDAAPDGGLVYFKYAELRGKVVIDRDNVRIAGNVHAAAPLDALFETSGYRKFIYFENLYVDGREQVDAIFKVHGISIYFVNAVIKNLKPQNGIGIWAGFDSSLDAGHELTVLGCRIYGGSGHTLDNASDIAIKLDRMSDNYIGGGTIISDIGKYDIHMTPGAPTLWISDIHIYSQDVYNVYAQASNLFINDAYIEAGKRGVVYVDASGVPTLGGVRIYNSWLNTFLTPLDTYSIVTLDGSVNQIFDVSIRDCIMNGGDGVNSRAKYSVELKGNVGHVTIENCSPLYESGGGVLNWSKTRNMGVAYIPAGSSYVDVNHGLIRAPDKVFLTILNASPDSLSVSNITPTTFRINRTSTAYDTWVQWEAVTF